jgi:predicted nucleic acid-binding Zn ribbon protein
LARREPESIGDILKRVTKKLGIEAKLREQTLFSVWDETVGRQIARHARPKSIKRGDLVVLVENSSYLQEYSFLKRELREKLNEKLGKNTVREVMFRVGRIEKK